MASVNETKKKLETFFAAAWTTTPIKWPNIAFEPTKNSSGDRLPYVTFSHHETEIAGGGNITLGSPLASRFFRWAGIIVNEVYVPENYPDAGLITRYLGMMTDLWNMQTLLYDDSNGDQASCRLHVPWATEVGIINGWYMWNLTIPYVRDSPS